MYMNKAFKIQLFLFISISNHLNDHDKVKNQNSFDYFNLINSKMQSNPLNLNQI